MVTVTVNGTLSDLTVRLGGNGEAYFADGVDDFDDDEDSESEITSTDVAEEEVEAIEALSAMRLDTPTGTPERASGRRPRTSEDGAERNKPTEEELNAAMRSINDCGMTAVPSIELSLCEFSLCCCPLILDLNNLTVLCVEKIFRDVQMFLHQLLMFLRFLEFLLEFQHLLSVNLISRTFRSFLLDFSFLSVQLYLCFERVCSSACVRERSAS